MFWSFWIFIKKNFFATQILKCFTVQNRLFGKNLEMIKKIHFLGTQIQKIIKPLTKTVLVCSMVFAGSPVNTLNLFFCQMFYYFFIKVHEKYIFYHFNFIKKKIVLVLPIKVILNSKAFKYLRY